MNAHFITGNIQVEDLVIPTISTQLNVSDIMGAVMVRWGINRDNYRVSPGLYAIGSPLAPSDVFVTANYKLTFDQVRKNLDGMNAWLLVLDTKGVNVWCAAGKGTFSSKELAHRIELSFLKKIVSHRRIILPQLSATGVAAHKIKELTGFNVHYGPVLAADIKQFVANGYHSDEAMRKVKFSFRDRLKLVPNDFMYGKYYLLVASALIVMLSSLSPKGFSVSNISASWSQAVLKISLAYFAGIVVTPVLLPYLPGRYFSFKGFFAGMIIFLATLPVRPHNNTVETIAWFFLIGALSSFTAMNFTGSSTFTSLSGVKKEMKLFLPLQIGFAATGIILMLVSKLINI